MESSETPLLFILSGPAGSGKTTLCNRLLAEFDTLERIVTATTREMRAGELDGEDYFFFSQEQFEQKVENDELLEWALVHGRAYGTPKAEVVRRFQNAQDVLLSIDVQGMRQVLEKAESVEWLRNRVVTIFIQPPSLDELRTRLKARGTDSTEEIERRIETARTELQSAKEFHYLLETSSKDEDFDRVRAIYLAEKMRPRR
ncbi:MAG: guanylate kinase [Verrucomicrobiota bacterium]